MKRTMILIMLLSESLLGQSGLAYLGLSSPPSTDFSTTENTWPSTSYTPFELAGGMIFVEADLNGRRAHFIFDTGAPGLVLNTRQRVKGHQRANGVLGETELGQVEVDHFRWAGWEFHGVSAATMDMRSFEDLTGRSIDGLIGYDFIKGKEVFIDFDNRLIRLSLRSNPIDGKMTPRASTAFRLLDHLPIVKVKLGGKNAYFGLDTGSEINILHSRWRDRLPGKLKNGHLLQVDGKRQKVETMVVDQLSIGRVALDEMNYYLVDLSALEAEYGVQLDGILGFPFFHSQAVSLNFSRRKLCLWH